MLKAFPIQSKDEQERICGLCAAEYDADLMAYEVTVDDKLVGICQFTINKRGGSLKCLCSVPGVFDFQAMFVLGRATLNFIDLCGIRYAYYDGGDVEKNDALIKAIGFKKVGSDYRVDLLNFFTHPCQHDGEKQS